MKKKKFLTTGSLFKIEQDDEKILLSALHKLSVEEQDAVKNILSKLDEANEKISVLERRLREVRKNFRFLKQSYEKKINEKTSEDFLNFFEEDWKDIEGYDGHYKINKNGMIVSDKFAEIWSPIKITVDKHGYPKVQLTKNGKSKAHFLHRLLAEAFIPNPENLHEVNHIDGDKTNYNLSNLEWVTRSENILHAFRNGLHKPICGSKNPLAKLTEDDVRYIRSHYKPRDKEFSAMELAKKFDLSKSTIYSLLWGQTYKDIE